MSFQFKNKTVYLLSSDRWGTMRVSKHHYALELAEKGNKVFFVEPPDLNNKGIKVTPSDENESLFIVSYRPVYRGKQYLPHFFYRSLLHWQVHLLKEAIGEKPDIVWCFAPYLFLNLNWFKASVNIFFGSDLFHHNILPEEVLRANICFGVSDTITKQLQQSGKPTYFINHGLSKHFVEGAKKQLIRFSTTNVQRAEKIIVGYVGNLLMEAPDRTTMRTVIASNKDIKFVFWGQYENKGNFVAFDKPEVFEFIDFLKSQPNVVLRGAVHPAKLNEEIKEVDMFWLCWQLNHSELWDGSNSHKLLEYFSTGKPVVSHYMSTYKDNELIDMLPVKDNSKYPALFLKVLDRVKQGEPFGIQQKRIQFAVNNTYNAQILNIEGLIQKHFKEGSF